MWYKRASRSLRRKISSAVTIDLEDGEELGVIADIHQGGLDLADGCWKNHAVIRKLLARLEGAIRGLLVLGDWLDLLENRFRRIWGHNANRELVEVIALLLERAVPGNHDMKIKQCLSSVGLNRDRFAPFLRIGNIFLGHGNELCWWNAGGPITLFVRFFVRWLWVALQKTTGISSEPPYRTSKHERRATVVEGNWMRFAEDYAAERGLRAVYVNVGSCVKEEGVNFATISRKKIGVYLMRHDGSIETVGELEIEPDMVVFVIGHTHRPKVRVLSGRPNSVIRGRR